MKIIGAILWIVGALLFVYASFVFEPSINGTTEFDVGRVVNLDLQQRQMLLSMAGLAMFVSGSIIHAMAELLAVPANSSNFNPPDVIGERDEAMAPSPADTDDLMARLGVVGDGERFRFGPYTYTALDDAIRYARTHQHER